MPILIRNGSENDVVVPTKFSNESELESVLSEFPDLLMDDGREDGAPKIKFVDRQVTLPDAGRLDLLFVDGEGIPIAVETKLARNAEARREVVAQVIDYLSSLTSLTVDELDKRVNGKLEAALRALAEGEESGFDGLWQKVGENLRDGRARIVVALDEAPADLQRIFRFLARRSDLDVLLVSVRRYASPKLGKILVPQILVAPALAERSGVLASSKKPSPELDAAFEAYNESSPPGLQAVGTASDYRSFRPADWPGREAAYSFRWRSGHIGVQLGISRKSGPAAVQAIAAVLSGFDGRSVADGQANLAWNPEPTYHHRGRLLAELPAATPPKTVAQAMTDLISITCKDVGEKIKALASPEGGVV